MRTTSTWSYSPASRPRISGVRSVDMWSATWMRSQKPATLRRARSTNTSSLCTRAMPTIRTLTMPLPGLRGQCLALRCAETETNGPQSSRPPLARAETSLSHQPAADAGGAPRDRLRQADRAVERPVATAVQAADELPALEATHSPPSLHRLACVLAHLAVAGGQLRAVVDDHVGQSRA